MPRLSELLEWLASGGPELDKIWVLLDIKVSSSFFLLPPTYILYCPSLRALWVL